MKQLKQASTKLGLLAAGIVAASVVQSQAVPILQLYIEGATYDTASETWVADFSSGDTIRLWTIGNVAGDGGKGTIYDVKLAIAYSSGDNPNIMITESTTGGYNGFIDPSVANTAVFNKTVTDGSLPKLGDGSSLPDHGVYGAGTSWTEYGLGDFSKSDAKGGDFINALPSPPASGYDINVYEITITGTDFVHFDLYDHYLSNSGMAKYKFAPFSHDAEGGRVPDGGSTLALLGLALVGVGVAFRKFEASTSK